MKIAYISHALSAGLQKFLLDKGHELFVIIGLHLQFDEPITEDGFGLAPMYPGKLHMVTDVQELAQCDFYFIDFNCPDYALIDAIRDLGIPGIAPIPFTDQLESDRAFGKSIARNLGLASPTGEQVNNSADVWEALNNLDDLGQKFFLKGSKRTFVARTRDEALNIMSPINWGRVTTGSVYIESEVEGYERAFGRYWTGTKFLDVVVSTREIKEAAPYGMGNILTGEVATVISFDGPDVLPEYAATAFDGLEAHLLGTAFKGFIDMNFIEAATGIGYFLEWTTRPGWPTELELAGYLSYCELDYGKFLYAIATDTPFEIPSGSGFASALYAHGTGLASFATLDTLNLKVYNLPSEADSVKVLHFSTIWKDGEVFTSEWDRALFIVNYWRRASQGYFSLHNAVSRVQAVLAKTHAWGHVHRCDLTPYRVIGVYQGDHVIPGTHKY